MAHVSPPSSFFFLPTPVGVFLQKFPVLLVLGVSDILPQSHIRFCSPHGSQFEHNQRTRSCCKIGLLGSTTCMWEANLLRTYHPLLLWHVSRH